MVQKRILFTRQYLGFSGGHLKHTHYLSHAQAYRGLSPILHVTPDSKHDALEPLLPADLPRTDLPCEADILFVAGLDWDILDAAGQPMENIPVINFVQHVRHANPSDARYQFLPRPAIRICVSQQVSDALEATGKVNGPIITIENGLDLPPLSAQQQPPRNGKILIAGSKDRKLAAAISSQLTTLQVPHDISDGIIPRGEYLNMVSQYSVLICLPHPIEGFYLPALEAMAMGVNVVTPDCVGARSFCRHNDTCLVTARSQTALAEAAISLLSDSDKARRLKEGGLEISKHYTLARERAIFHSLLDDHFR